MNDHTVKISGPVEVMGKNGISLNMIPSNASVVTIANELVFPIPVLLFIGTGGDVAVIPWDQSDLTAYRVFKSVPDGTFLPIYVKMVATAAHGTAATNILACY
jgi:hypothetical protein